LQVQNEAAVGELVAPAIVRVRASDGGDVSGRAITHCKAVEMATVLGHDL
jgi:hypothetical protein